MSRPASRRGHAAAFPASLGPPLTLDASVLPSEPIRATKPASLPAASTTSKSATVRTSKVSRSSKRLLIWTSCAASRSRSSRSPDEPPQQVLAPRAFEPG